MVAGGSTQDNQQDTTTQDTTTVGNRASVSASIALESLTPQFNESQHGSYLRRLEEAVKDPRNRNIAVTGRYGAGKSSVLDQFQANHRRSVQRLAISTLAPGEEGETTTNRIQKEVVKQLLYGASHKVGKNSRFSRIAVLSRRRALLESLVTVACVGALLYLLGRLPDVKWTDSGRDAWQRVAAWGVVAAVVTSAVFAVRRVTYGRFRVSDFSAGGAGLTLAESAETPFDQYIDEIVHYFGRESKDIVIFEDLDRFEDPHIFEALRELNVLLNNTPERRARRRGNRPGRAIRRLLGLLPGDVPARVTAWLPFPWAARLLGLGVPIRFVYAVKDSVFEQIDTETAGKAVSTAAAKSGKAPVKTGGMGAAGGTCSGSGESSGPGRTATGVRLDAAAAEAMRANRTKFFDVVIPLVPFISHRNARELLYTLLADRGIKGIDRSLIAVVAQHATDMRLLRNMCNEYLLFAERLLESEHTAPNLDESKLFALVAYKNFHLGDFENISRRDSDLDRLYDLHQRMVRECIADREQTKRDLEAAPARERERDELCARLAARLRRYADAEQRFANLQWSVRFLQFKVGSRTFKPEQLAGQEFWVAVAREGSLTITGYQNEGGAGARDLVTWGRTELAEVLPEALDADRWADNDITATRADIGALDSDIGALRRADFEQLAAARRFTLRVPAPDPANYPEAQVDRTFTELIDETLKSDLACDLVKRGYIDRNFSLYAAQFYGKFTGIDVATFMVRHVQTNTMHVDYDLSRAGAAANVLAEAASSGEDLLRTVAVYNVDLVNHMLRTEHPGLEVVVEHLVTELGEDERTFLAAFFNSDAAERGLLAAKLAAHPWHGVFHYLVADEAVPDHVRPELVSAALGAAHLDNVAAFDIDDDIRRFIVGHYAEMPAFTGQQKAGEDTDEHADPDGGLDAGLDAGPEVGQDAGEGDGAVSTAGQGDDEAVVDPAAAAAAAAVATSVARERRRVAFRVVAVLERASIVIPSLAPLDDELRRFAVARNRYELTADNLRAALGVTGGVTLDEIRERSLPKHRPVYDFVLDNPGAYLAAVAHDDRTPHVIDSAETLEAFLDDIARWAPSTRDEYLGQLLDHVSPAARLRSLRAVPTATWRALAAAGLFRASLANVEDYRNHFDDEGTDGVDDALATLLEGAGTIHVDEDADTVDEDGDELDRSVAAIAILNATTISSPAARVSLAAAIGASTPLKLADINPEPGDLLALLLDHGLVEDDEATFGHFQGAGWEAIRPAISSSKNVAKFLTPDLVEGMVADLLDDPDARAKVGDKILKDLDAYVPDNGQKMNDRALRIAAYHADAKGIALPPATVLRIAHAFDSPDADGHAVVLRLLCNAAPAATARTIVDVFVSIGGTYAKVGTPGADFELPRDEFHSALLDKLSPYVTYKKKKLQEFNVVKVHQPVP